MTANRFDGKILLITGGNSGIGLATATRLVSEDVTVVITGRNRETLNRAVHGLGKPAHGITTDVTQL